MKATEATHLHHHKSRHHHHAYLVGLDFDLTLSCHRVYGRRDFGNITDYIFGGDERISLLKRFLCFLTQHNVRVIIISWNFKDIIQEALQHVGLLEYISCIYDRHSMTSSGGGYKRGKQLVVQQVARLYNIPLNQTIFVDDDAHVLDKMTCCHTVLVQKQHGMCLEEMQQVVHLLGLATTFDPAQQEVTMMKQDDKTTTATG